MHIPRTINKLTLRQYIQFRQIEESNLDNVDMGENLLSIVTGLTIAQINDLPMWKYDFYFKRIADLRATTPRKRIKKYIWIKGKRYKCVPSERHLNTNQLLAADTFNTDVYENFNKLAAVIYTPCPVFGKGKFSSDHFDELANEFLSKKLGSVSGAVFFYSNRFQQLKEISRFYSNQSTRIIAERMTEVREELEALGVNTDGTTSSILSQVATLSKKTS